MKSAIDWIEEDLVTNSSTSPVYGPVNDLEYEIFYKKLSEIAVRNIAFEEEILSHLSAIQEINRREQSERDTRAHAILDRLDKIEKKIKQIELAQDIESKLGGVCRQIDVFVIEKPRGSVQIENIEVLIQN